VLTEAIVQHRFRGISDPDQAWVLGELIAYLDSRASGAGGFEDMGDKWVSVRKAAHDGTLRANDAEADTVAERWEEFTQYLCLGLSQDLGRRVTSPRARGQVTAARLDGSVKELASDGALTALLRVPDAVGDIRIRADLRARRTLTSVSIEAPREGRAKPRINWLLRQLVDAPGDLQIEAVFPNARQTTSELLADAREEPGKLLHPADPKREPRAFTITLARPMGKKRGKTEGSFVRETRAQTSTSTEISSSNSRRGNRGRQSFVAKAVRCPRRHHRNHPASSKQTNARWARLTIPLHPTTLFDRLLLPPQR
jgi:hypothetical protein